MPTRMSLVVKPVRAARLCRVCGAGGPSALFYARQDGHVGGVMRVGTQAPRKLVLNLHKFLCSSNTTAVS